jgi:hypothetical protein
MSKVTLFYGLSTTNKLRLLMALLVSISLPLPIRINSIFIFSVVIGFILAIVTEKRFVAYTFKSNEEWLILLLFLIPIAGLTHTSNLDQGLKDIERSAFLISFLFIVGQMRNLNVSVFNLIMTFAVGCFSVTLFGLGYTLLVLEGNERSQVFELGHSYFADIILIHPVYLSIFFIFIFFFLLETIRTLKPQLGTGGKIGIAMAEIFIVAILFFLKSQMSLVIFVMLLVMYSIIVLKRRGWLVTFVLFTVALLVFLLDTKRVNTVFDTYGKNVSSALDHRFSVWRGTIEGIKTATFFGAGTGGEQELINLGYVKIGYREGIDNSYNAHNQYLQFLARNGIMELGCFLALLFYSFRQSLKMPNYTYLMFNMAITLIMFTESFLDVQRGIVFFYFFLCAFIYLPYESTTQTFERV